MRINHNEAAARTFRSWGASTICKLRIWTVNRDCHFSSQAIGGQFTLSHWERTGVRENRSTDESAGLRKQPFRSLHGYLEIDLFVALAILALAIVPLGFSFTHERTALRADYCRAVANEIVDGEMEILAAGDWKEFPDGSRAYSVHSRAAKNLPPGHFQLTKAGKHLRLEWTPDGCGGVGAVVREITVP